MPLKQLQCWVCASMPPPQGAPGRLLSHRSAEYQTASQRGMEYPPPPRTAVRPAASAQAAAACSTGQSALEGNCLQLLHQLLHCLQAGVQPPLCPLARHERGAQHGGCSSHALQLRCCPQIASAACQLARWKLPDRSGGAQCATQYQRDRLRHSRSRSGSEADKGCDPTAAPIAATRSVRL